MKHSTYCMVNNADTARADHPGFTCEGANAIIVREAEEHNLNADNPADVRRLMDMVWRRDTEGESKAAMHNAVLALAHLAQVVAAQGTGPDGAFVDVSGGVWMLPQFPLYLVDMLELHETKNKQYRGNDPDPLANYVNAGRAMGVKGWQYAFGRMAEKMNRAGHVLPEASDPAETMLDLAVIALLVLRLRSEDR
jgi:hypothetical protein